MREKLLNEKCQFCCNGNPLMQIKATEYGNHTAKDGHYKLLTTKAKCSVQIPLSCSYLTAQAGGTPTPCAIITTVWKGSSKKIICNGQAVLTKDSSILCSHGGTIKPLMTSCITGLGGTLSVGDVEEFAKKMDKTKEINRAGIIDEEAKKGANTKHVDSQLEDRLLQVKKEETPYDSYALCNYEDCIERESCEYFRTKVQIDNNSTKLASNFKQKRRSEWEEYQQQKEKQMTEATTRGWRTAAHHLISGNQILLRTEEQTENGEIRFVYGSLIKLANYFGYDVNCAENGIMLPTNESNFGEKEVLYKNASAYEVMSLSKRQWHVGGHKYTLSEDSLEKLQIYYKNHPEQYTSDNGGAFFTDYVMAVKEELDKLLNRYSKVRCWKKRKEVWKEKFLEDIYAVSKKIESYLLSFRSNPKRSFPFFVSKVAVEYAFDLPVTIKLGAIYQKAGVLHMKKVQLQRYNGKPVIPKEKEDQIIEGWEIEQFVKFCENTIYFCLEERLAFSFPFIFEKDIGPYVYEMRLSSGQGVMSYLQENGNQLMAFIKGCDTSYQAVKQVCDRRLGIQDE